MTADAEALHYSANLARYLDFPSGTPSQNVLLMARTGLRAPLRAALKQAAETGHSIERSGIAVQAADGRSSRVDLLVEPRREQGVDTVFLVVFLVFGVFRRGSWRAVSDARAVLADRFARGDISAEEYRARLSELSRK